MLRIIKSGITYELMTMSEDFQKIDQIAQEVSRSDYKYIIKHEYVLFREIKE